MEASEKTRAGLSKRWRTPADEARSARHLAVRTQPKRKSLRGIALQPAQDTLIAVHRSFEEGELREAFRTLLPRNGPKPLRAFSFLEVEGEDEPRRSSVDLVNLARESRK